ncbi:unnamed protein product, partial [Phaeothamnion confervicola]
LQQVDGQEDIASGLSLSELADVLAGMGVESAVNLDGGGSSVAVGAGGVVLGRPTCLDTATVCERAVANIMCVR